MDRGRGTIAIRLLNVVTVLATGAREKPGPPGQAGAPRTHLGCESVGLRLPEALAGSHEAPHGLPAALGGRPTGIPSAGRGGDGCHPTVEGVFVLTPKPWSRFPKAYVRAVGWHRPPREAAALEGGECVPGSGAPCLLGFWFMAVRKCGD